ncbi:hypothetical protein JOB18_003788 [Solea senegalensis]|uniref:Uncharacterized protein n=1 Tax=Solea senegalensis TaxID=28829 RepID=A0AAV6SJQ6_SOLSE|nr:hypothetical protein JOB18_003788 [Solea senegalensis]
MLLFHIPEHLMLPRRRKENTVRSALRPNVKRWLLDAHALKIHRHGHPPWNRRLADVHCRVHILQNRVLLM